MAASNRDAAARAEGWRAGECGSPSRRYSRTACRRRKQRSRRTPQRTCGRGSGRCHSPDDGGLLQIKVEDAGSRLSLNALFAKGEARDEKSEIFLAELLTKVIEEIPVRPEQKLYDVQVLARNLIDWVDVDSVRASGGEEDDYYQSQSPPYRSANLPLLSMDDAADRRLRPPARERAAALRGCVAVRKADGVNPNTAPSWVLALLYHGQPGAERLANEDTVRRILDIREQNGILCADERTTPPACHCAKSWRARCIRHRPFTRMCSA